MQKEDTSLISRSQYV